MTLLCLLGVCILVYFNNWLVLTPQSICMSTNQGSDSFPAHYVWVLSELTEVLVGSVPGLDLAGPRVVVSVCRFPFLLDLGPLAVFLLFFLLLSLQCSLWSGIIFLRLFILLVLASGYRVGSFMLFAGHGVFVHLALVSIMFLCSCLLFWLQAPQLVGIMLTSSSLFPRNSIICLYCWGELIWQF